MSKRVQVSEAKDMKSRQKIIHTFVCYIKGKLNEFEKNKKINKTIRNKITKLITIISPESFRKKISSYMITLFDDDGIYIKQGDYESEYSDIESDQESESDEDSDN